MKYFINIIYVIAFIFYVPFLLFRDKWHSKFCSRLGTFDSQLQAQLHGKNNIWIHAVSVGEVMAIIPFIRKLKARFPQFQIVCSTVTTTGYALATDQLANEACVIFAPLDFSWVVDTYIKYIQPKVYISTETEFWPNLYSALSRNQSSVIVINGRISEESYKGYKKFLFIFKQSLASVKKFCVQTKEDEGRLLELGVSQEQINVVGNLKFDGVDQADLASKQEFGFNDSDDLFVAGSTHPGEEIVILEIYKKLIKKSPQLKLIIVPRHIERSKGIASLIEEQGFEAVCSTQLSDKALTRQKIYVVDSIGQLKKLYSIAKIVFIGKTMTAKGGQNMIEPAAYGKPTFLGPYTQNFKDVTELFLKNKAMVQVQTKDELFESIEKYLNDPQALAQMGLAAKGVVEENKGATQKTLEYVSSVIG